jgi:hypothetical protein
VLLDDAAVCDRDLGALSNHRRLHPDDCHLTGNDRQQSSTGNDLQVELAVRYYN